MVKHAQLQTLSFDAVQRMRTQAGSLLDRLIADRDLSEQRQAEQGKRDPIKSVTGRSALDNAIASTRDLMQRLDDLMLQMSDSLPHVEVSARVAARAHGRSPGRAHARSTPAVLVP